MVALAGRSSSAIVVTLLVVVLVAVAPGADVGVGVGEDVESAVTVRAVAGFVGPWETAKGVKGWFRVFFAFGHG
jgi:hypothetical protein